MKVLLNVGVTYHLRRAKRLRKEGTQWLPTLHPWHLKKLLPAEQVTKPISLWRLGYDAPQECWNSLTLLLVLIHVNRITLNSITKLVDSTMIHLVRTLEEFRCPISKWHATPNNTPLKICCTKHYSLGF